MICQKCNRDAGVTAECPFCGAKLLKQPLPHHLPAGTVIDGRYRIEGVLGEGGFGITYLGYNEKLGLPVAVKEYFPQGVSYRNMTGRYEVYVGAEDAQAFYDHGKERFLSEAKTLVRFNSEPGVVSVMDFVEENNTAYLIMEYLDGETLLQYLRKHGKLGVEDAFGMLRPMMQTLEKIHAAGVIHRDISPDNIMRLKDGRLKLMDFGAAREFDNGDPHSMSVLLKVGYAPEEQYRRGGEQGPWTDVYALCATVYRCITGEAPLEAIDRMVSDTLETPSQLGVPITPAMENLLMYGLAVHKKDRCKSITEFLQLLDRAKDAGGRIPYRDPEATVSADAPVRPERQAPRSAPQYGGGAAVQPKPLNIASPIRTAEPQRDTKNSARGAYTDDELPGAIARKTEKKNHLLYVVRKGMITCLCLSLLFIPSALVYLYFSIDSYAKNTKVTLSGKTLTSVSGVIGLIAGIILLSMGVILLVSAISNKRLLSEYGAKGVTYTKAYFSPRTAKELRPGGTGRQPVNLKHELMIVSDDLKKLEALAKERGLR